MKNNCLRPFLVLVSVVLILSFCPLIVFGSGPSDPAATKYPIIMAHGMGFEPSPIMDHSFGDIISTLEDEGAEVYYTTVPAIDGTRTKALAFRDQVLYIQAATNAEKFNIIAHSHGALYTRDAIANLGIAQYTASQTSMSGTNHGGSTNTLMDLSLWLMDIIGQENINKLFEALGFGSNMPLNLSDLSPRYVVDVFNPNTPNQPGILYQSWAAAYRYYDTFGFLNELADILSNPTGDQFSVSMLSAAMPLTAATVWMTGGGTNDGLVTSTSAQWGNYRGLIRGPWYSPGVSHIAIVDLDYSPGFDAPQLYLDIVSELKDNGY